MSVITTVANVVNTGIGQVYATVVDDCNKWWLGISPISPEHCIAAYQAIWVESYADSKINLANPGTYDAVDGATPPTWDNSKGWIFNKDNSQYLTTGIIPDTGWTMIIKFNTSWFGNCWICGVDSASNARFYLSPSYSSALLYGSGGYATRSIHRSGGVLCIAGQQPYINGVTDGAPLANWNAAQTNGIDIGCLNSIAGNPIYPYDGIITSMAIYDTILSQEDIIAIGQDMPGLYYDQEHPTISGQNALILFPSNYDDVVGAPLIIHYHGLLENELSLINDYRKAPTLTALLNAGYIVATSNAHGDNWGNDDSLTDYENLYSYCVANYNITRTCAWSISMGGHAGLLGVAAGVIPYKGWLGTYPACNLAWCYGDALYTASINAAYNIPGGGDYATQTAGHDSVLLDPDLFIGIRMRFYASPSDTYIHKDENSDVMSASVSGHATEDTIVVCSGDHGDMSHFQFADYVDFFDRCV